MDLDDSESSLSDFEGEGDGVSTNVLLGYATKEPAEDLTSHLGGEPTWLAPFTPAAPPKAPSAHYAQCGSCQSHMPLLLQLNGDMPDRFPGHERRLYVFGCRKRACRRKEGSVRALRGVKTSRTAEAASPSRDRRAISGAGTAKTDTSQQPENGSRPNEPVERKRDIGAALFGGKSDDGLGRQTSSANPFSTSTGPPSGNGISKTNGSSRPDPEPKANPFSTLPDPSTLAAKPAQKPAKPSPLATTNIPSTTSGSNQSEADLSATFAEKARLTSPVQHSKSLHQSNSAHLHQKQEHKPWPKSTELPKSYPHYYLDAEYEYLDPNPDDTNDASRPSNHHAAFLDYSETADTNIDIDIDDYAPDAATSARKPNNSSSKAKGKNAADKKEDAAVASLKDSQTDRTFQHFADTVAQNADQVLRYEFGGRPLLYSRTDAVGRLFSPHQAEQGQQSTSAVRATKTTHGSSNKVSASTPEPQDSPPCPYCASPRVFEFQITPHAIVELEAEQDAAMILQEGMEWGTVVVCVCGEDCLGGDSGSGSVSGGGDVREGEVSYVEEWVGVQWEEVVKGRRR
ncbi:MAG: hypothetical protein M1831_005238 [Alyxoria varia]|nr:MAG: hypothetical protein M1831_005238 [Alyxoria varia]